jgi:hypothetical protein
MGRLKSFGAKKLATTKSEKDDAPQHGNGADKDENAGKTEEELANGNGVPTKDTPYTFADVLFSIRKRYESALNPSEPTPEKSDEASVSSISKIPVLEEGRLKSAMSPSGPDDTPVKIRSSLLRSRKLAWMEVWIYIVVQWRAWVMMSICWRISLLDGWVNYFYSYISVILFLMWQDKLPKKEVVKISFSLKPHSKSTLPEMLAGYFLAE